MANPALNATTSTIPNPNLSSEIAPSSNTSAAGQGTSPPLTPSATSPRHVIFEPSAGKWCVGVMIVGMMVVCVVRVLRFVVVGHRVQAAVEE